MPKTKMKRVAALIILVSYLNNSLTANEKANGWKLLWDGKTTEGWRGAALSSFPVKGWTIDDGMLIPNKGENKAGGDIVTLKKYKNFFSVRRCKYFCNSSHAIITNNLHKHGANIELV